MVNKNAEIIPYIGMGGVYLYRTIEELHNILQDNNAVKIDLHNGWTKYIIKDIMELYFCNKNNKLFKMNTLSGYKGKLFNNIYVGMSKKDLLATDKSFKYNDFDEVYESNKGVFIETDVIVDTVKYITVYIPEMEDEDFDNI